MKPDTDSKSTPSDRALDARLTFIERILAIPERHVFKCMESLSECPIAREEADGCVTNDGKLVCPLMINKIDKMLIAFSEVQRDIVLPMEVLKELAKNNIINESVLTLATTKIKLHQKIRELAVRRERLEKFKKNGGYEGLILKLEELISETEKDVANLSALAQVQENLLRGERQ